MYAPPSIPTKTTLVITLSSWGDSSHSDLTDGPTKDSSIISMASEIHPMPAYASTRNWNLPNPDEKMTSSTVCFGFPLGICKNPKFQKYGDYEKESREEKLFRYGCIYDLFVIWWQVEETRLR